MEWVTLTWRLQKLSHVLRIFTKAVEEIVWLIRIETTTHRVTTMLGDLRYDAQLIPERVLTKTMVQVC